MFIFVGLLSQATRRVFTGGSKSSGVTRMEYPENWWSPPRFSRSSTLLRDLVYCQTVSRLVYPRDCEAMRFNRDGMTVLETRRPGYDPETAGNTLCVQPNYGVTVR